MHAKQATMQRTTPSMPSTAVPREPDPPHSQKQTDNDPPGAEARGAVTAVDTFWWVEPALFVVLTLSCVRAADRCRGDPGDLAFVAFIYLVHVLIWCCHWQHDRVEPRLPVRRRRRGLNALLSAAFTLVITYKVGDDVPAAAAAFGWALGLATAARGFLDLLCIRWTAIIPRCLARRGLAQARRQSLAIVAEA